jgi:hypothetical protein
MKAQSVFNPAARRLSRARRRLGVTRFAAWQRRTAAATPVLVRLLRLLAR